MLVWGHGHLGTSPMHEIKEGALPATWGSDCSLGEGSGGRVRDEVESLREFVGELIHCVGEAPKLFRRGNERGKSTGCQITTYIPNAQRSRVIMPRVNVPASIVCLPWLHKSTCSIYFESAHHDSNWLPTRERVWSLRVAALWTLIKYGFVDAICTVKSVRRAGCSSKTLSENPKGLRDIRRLEGRENSTCHPASFRSPTHLGLSLFCLSSQAFSSLVTG